MQRLTWKKELSLQGGRPSGFDELQIAAVIRPVELVADDGQAEMMQMHANLMHAAGFGLRLDQREAPVPVLEALAELSA